MIRLLEDSERLAPVRAMRDAYSETIVELGAADKRVMVVDVDCSRSMGSGAFRAAYPERYINCGIQEANAVGVCAGLSEEGLIPFFNAFGVFATRRAYDQVFLSCGYAHLNVRIIGWDAGIGAESNGGTHMPLEDIGLMRSVPDMTVIEPADPAAFASILKQSVAYQGNIYIRCMRKSVPSLYQKDSTFTIGRAAFLREGTDAAVIACGRMVAEALKAADILVAQGIQVRILDMYTIKPLDERAVLDAAKETGALVTAENHRCINGLYSAVTDLVAREYPVPVEGVGVDDIFGEVGSADYLMRHFGLTAEDIVKKVKKAIARKEN